MAKQKVKWRLDEILQVIFMVVVAIAAIAIVSLIAYDRATCKASHYEVNREGRMSCTGFNQYSMTCEPEKDWVCDER